MKKIIILSLLSISSLLADKPVYVDEILTKVNSFKMNMTVSYANIQYAKGIQQNTTYQTQNGDFVSLPTYLGNAKSNQDYLNYALSLRYGMTKDLEMFSSVNFYNSSNHLSIKDTFKKDTDSGFNSVVFGANYQVKKENDTPSLLIGLSTNVVERTQFGAEEKKSNFKSGRLFATSFYTVDPVVFSLSTSYGINLKKTDGDKSIENGDIFTLSPEIYFAVNPYTSLSAGVKYTYTAKSKQDDKQISNDASALSFLMGMSYEFSTKTVLNVNTEYLNSNDRSQASLSTTLSYTF